MFISRNTVSETNPIKPVGSSREVPVLKKVVTASLVLGALGPLMLGPVVIWLDSHSHDFRTDMRWEAIFRWCWPTSLMLMTGGGAKPFTLAYMVLLLISALSNIVLFGLISALLGAGFILVRSVSRMMRAPK